MFGFEKNCTIAEFKKRRNKYLMKFKEYADVIRENPERLKEIYKNLIKSENLHESYQVKLFDSILYVHDPLEIIERMRDPTKNRKANLVKLGFRGIVAV